MEEATDTQMLDLHFHRAGAYIAAGRDLECFCKEHIDGLLVLIDCLYRQGLARLEVMPASKNVRGAQPPQSDDGSYLTGTGD